MKKVKEAKAKVCGYMRNAHATLKALKQAIKNPGRVVRLEIVAGTATLRR